MNQSVCHHLITKNCLPGIMLIIHVFRSFGGVYPRDGAVVGVGEIAIFVMRNARLVDKSRRERNVEICFASVPPSFPSPSLFRFQ